MQFFSFEKYINLQKRVDRLEYEIELKNIAKQNDQINSNALESHKDSKVGMIEHIKADSSSESDEETKVQFSGLQTQDQ